MIIDVKLSGPIEGRYLVEVTNLIFSEAAQAMVDEGKPFVAGKDHIKRETEIVYDGHDSARANEIFLDFLDQKVASPLAN